MNKFTTALLALSFLLSLALIPQHAFAQSVTVSGTVVDTRNGEPLIGANVVVRGTVSGVATDINGQFTLNTNQSLPFVLRITSVGYTSAEITVTEEQLTGLTIRLDEQAFFGSEVVLSASRVEQSVLQSPVAIERMDIIAIRETAAPNFYDALANLKGVDMSAQSLTFRSVNTRGFAANGNTRFVQLIDGIDNQAPGLNFAVGNVVGISDLDLESVELIPGVASALYGPNAINGILLLNSKSPFDFPGLSVQVRTGFNHVDGRDDDPSLYQDYSMRWAQRVSDRFAYKLNFSYLRASDFIGVDFRDQGPATFGAVERGATTPNGNRVYNGVNVYGQPLLNIGNIADGQIQAGNASVAAIRSLLPDGELGNFSPSGFTEGEFVDNITESLKFGAAMHYRISDNLEGLAQFNYGQGSTVYTANDRFVLDSFSIWTGKVEVRNPNFFLRAYTTQEDSGDTFAANTLASLINVETFVPAYFEAFAGARTQGATVEQAHNIARQAGEAAQPRPGSADFQERFDRIRAVPISEGGAKFLDNSALYHVEGLYNFSEFIDPELVEVIVGGNFRRFALDSQGTLFALQDNGDEFTMDEFGFYTQLSRSFLDGRLNMQGSLRYDKNENFAGQLSPRISATYEIFENQNLRLSYQEGFKIPTTQDQFIDLDVVTRRLVGANPVLVNRYNFETNTVYRTESVDAARLALASGQSAEQARALLQPVVFDEFKTEKISTVEVGYRGLFGNRLYIDAYYYYSEYRDFLAEIDFTQGIPNGLREMPDLSQFDPNSAAGQDAIINRTVPTQRFGFDVNADGVVKAHGFAVGADYSLGQGYTVGGNVTYNELISADRLEEQGFSAGFNTPKWRYNLSLRNRNVGNNVGFNVSWRWQDAFVWDSAIGQGVIPAFGTLDAQVSYRIPNMNTVVKFSGSNILNERYTTSFANPSMGAIYLVTFTFDQFLN
ncbi:Fe transport outer membrane receptor protein [Cyclonatronum proteinivorum]|uniref:Fe transport outer membrane receptor protein n=1 Tax=Cyclonatronum proteinivorum TaxID=1457365 RepID=A0A345UG06_9BACT|nr:TonB-dependent receptor [Cyclonatronum proteinivorum]AXI99407.1 Fe transport outer membrane receptor protein [Cyclonatronum proteinivorum]